MDEIINRITNYLSSGGLFNPELMEHTKVRDLLVDCRDEITKLKKGHEVFNQALHESSEREDKLRDRVAKLKVRLTDLSDHVDVLAISNEVATDDYNCLLMDFHEVKDELKKYKMGSVHDLIKKAPR